MSWMIDIRNLPKFHEMATVGASNAAENLGMMVGRDAEPNVRLTSAMSLKDLAQRVGQRKVLGVRVRLKDPPHGNALMLVPESKAKTLVALMLNDAFEDTSNVGGQMARSSVEEVGQVVTNGFIDGIADTMEQSIDVSTPQLVNAQGYKTVVRTAKRHKTDPVVVFDTSVTITSHDVEVGLFAFPDGEEFVGILEAIGPA